MSDIRIQIWELFEDGVLYMDIADRLNIPLEWVYGALKIDLEEYAGISE